MLRDIVNIIKDVSLRHKGVRTFRYQGKILNNAQNNHEYYQVYLDDVSLHELNITTNIFKVSFEMYILGFVDDEHEILEVQNNAYTVAADILAYIDNNPEYNGILSIHDYSILTVSHYTDDDAAGVRLSIVIATPNPVDLCSLDDNFNPEPYQPEPDKEIDIDKEDIGNIDLKPIKLPKNNRC
jgi:hypothetical protein